MQPKTIVKTLIALSIIGIYAIIPSTLEIIGYNTNKPQLLETASKLSLNPQEKARLYRNLSINFYGKEGEAYTDGDLAIKYGEKYAKGDYKNKQEILALLYFLKGYELKTLEIEKVSQKYNFTPQVYILKNDYQTALKYYEKKQKIQGQLSVSDKLLIKICYAELGQKEKAEQIWNEIFTENRSKYSSDIDFFNNFIQPNFAYLSIENFQKTVKEKQKSFKFS